MLDISFGGAALAGLLAFFSPCILPMVPFYFSYMGGMSVSELRGTGEIAPGAQRRLVISALFFALGVTTIFGLMGLGATAAGQAFRAWKEWLNYGAAAVILIFGLHFLGILRIPFLMREARMTSKSDPKTVVGAYVMGLAFGFGWTACVGPVLATILMIASTKETLMQGTALVLTFGLAMTSPFVVAAMFARPFLGWVSRNRGLMGHVEKVMGVMLIVFAILIATNSVGILSNWLIENFNWTATLR
ncbi:MAG: cytochrome C biogenesis protein CcdA [Rhodobacterales bacterium 17-64-5]|nr:MAG: cytochrome C biogenesis protein CcdA [Rhodobacterales bacterium 17-64-5]